MHPTRPPLAFAPRVLAVVILLHTAMPAAGMRAALSPDETGVVPAEVGASDARAAGAEGRNDANRTVAARPRIIYGRDMPLISSPKTSPEWFSTLIVERFGNNGTALISAVGPASCYNAFKAMMAASRYMGMGKLRPDRVVLAVLPSKLAISLRTGIDTTGFLLQVRDVPAVALVKKPDYSVTGETNVFELSVYMSQLVREKNMVTIGAMGSKAMYTVLKAAVYAQDSMSSQDRAAKQVQLAMVPEFRTIQLGRRTLKQMWITCVRVQA